MIPRYDRVLVTTDFSRLGNRAIDHAFALLGRGPGTVFLCHVLERPPLPNPLYAHYAPQRRLPEPEQAALVRAVEQKLRRLIPARRPRGVKVEVRVLETAEPVHEAICEHARAVRAKAIVIASRGRSSLARTILGSTTDRVLRTARQPVLVVRD
jgi:nucleotide-binding universal stress UspA family protein